MSTTRSWRRFQFSLRTLFIVTTLLAVLMSMLARPWRDYRREQAVLGAIGPGTVSVDRNYVRSFGSDLCSTVLGTTLYRRVVRLTFNAPPPEEFELARLAELSHLSELSLKNMPVIDDRLAGLSRLDGLEQLDLSGTQVTDAGLTHIEGLEKLRRVHTAGTTVTYEALEQLQAKLPEAEDLCQCRAVDELMLVGAYVQTEDTRGGDGLGKDTVGVRFSRTYQDAYLEHLAYLPRLKTLQLTYSTTDESLRSLPDLDALEELVVDSWKVEGPGLEHLARMNGLKNLRLQGVGFDKAGVQRLAELKNLEELYLMRTRLTGLDLEHLQQLPHLRKLVITETPYIYDIDLPRLAPIKTLKELTLTGVRISGGGVDRLRAMLPNVRIEVTRQTIQRPPDMGPLDNATISREGPDAFWEGDYDRMARVYREFAASPGASWQADLWLGHAEQLAGRWTEAVKAYRTALGKLDRDLRKNASTSPNDSSHRSWVASLEKRAQLLALVGRIELEELNHPSAAGSLFALSLRHVPEAAQRLDPLADSAAEVLDSLASPRASPANSHQLWSEWWQPFRTYRVLAEVRERQGDFALAIECFARIRLCNLISGRTLAQVQPEHIARLWSQLPADRPTPPMPIFLTPTPEQPEIEVLRDSGRSRLACWDTWGRYGILPPPGLCIDSLQIRCEGEAENEAEAKVKQKSAGCWLSNYRRSNDIVVVPVIQSMPPDALNELPATTWTKEFRAETPADKDAIFLMFRSPVPSRIVISCEFRPRGEGSSAPEEPTATPMLTESLTSATFDPVAPDSARFRTTRYKASALARLPDGRLLAAFGSEEDKILLSRSSDGIEWEEPYEYSGTSVFPTVGPSLAVDDDGLVRMVYVSKRPGIDRFSTGYYHVWTARSEDGRVWTDMKPVRMPYWPQYRGTTSIVRAPDGRYWTFRDGCAGVGIASENRWELLRLDLPARSDSLSPVNPHATFDATGRCHLVFDDFGRSLQYTWSDNMQTWSELQTLAKRKGGSSVAHPQLLIEGDRAALLYTTNQGIQFCRGTLTPDGLQLSEPEQIVDHWYMIEGFRLLRDDKAVYFQMQGAPPRLLRADLDELLGVEE